MKKFLVLYNAPQDALAQVGKGSAEDQQKGMEAWMNWAQRTGDNLKDLGAPLGASTRVTQSGSSQNADNMQVAGYSIIEAESMEAAEIMMDNHPHISMWHPDTTITLHEVMPIPGM